MVVEIYPDYHPTVVQWKCSVCGSIVDQDFDTGDDEYDYARY